MTIKYLINLTVTSLKYNVGRTILNILSVVIGMTALSIVLIIGSSVSNNIKNESKKQTEIVFNLYPTNFEKPLELDYLVYTNDQLQIIKNEVEGVESIEHLPEDILGRINGSDTRLFFDDNISVVEGESFINQVDNVAIATNFSFNETDTQKYNVGDKISINSILYTIIGLQDPFSFTGNEITLPSYAKENFKDKKFSNNVQITITDIGKKQEIIEQISKKLNTNIKDYEYQSMDFDSAIASIVNMVTLFFALLGSISLVVSMIGIMNMMYVSVLERQGEIAILRAIGLEKKNVVRLFLFESIFIMIVSSIISFLFGFLISFIILYFAKIPLYVSIYLIIGVLIFSIIIGILTGILPASRASNQNTSDILK